MDFLLRAPNEMSYSVFGQENSSQPFKIFQCSHTIPLTQLQTVSPISPRKFHSPDPNKIWSSVKILPASPSWKTSPSFYCCKIAFTSRLRNYALSFNKNCDVLSISIPHRNWPSPLNESQKILLAPKDSTRASTMTSGTKTTDWARHTYLVPFWMSIKHVIREISLQLKHNRRQCGQLKNRIDFR